ncbi:MAG: exopolysaccharide biosynthesis polyprenyl glycosylphosphotransferase [Candidatus Delongbacteria bacterium]
MPALLARLLLLCADLLLLAGSLSLGALLVQGGDPGDLAPGLFGGGTLRVFLFACVLWAVLAWQESLFRLEVQDPWDTFFAALRALGRSALLLALPLFLLRLEFPPGGMLAGLGLALLLLPLFRALVQGLLIGRLARLRRTLLVGSPAGLRLFFSLHRWERTANALGTLGVLLHSPRPDEAASDGADFPLPVLGGLDDLARVVKAQQVQQLLICAPRLSRDDLSEILQRAVGCVPQLYILPDIAVLDIAEVEISRVGGQPVLLFNQGLRSAFSAALKRTVDIVGAAGGLLVLSPLLLGVWLAVKLSSPGPGIYRHRRFGVGRKYIYLNKFRTMVTNADEVLEHLLATDPQARAEWAAQCKLKNDPRITRVGRILRKFSLDELPQIANVLMGDMSLVGPRPISEVEYDKYTVWQDNRMSVRPGLTGLWQVSGRADLDFEERIQLDMYYIRNWSIWLDFRIILKTLTVLVSKEGAY